MSVRSYKDLDAWRQALALAIDVYSLTQGFPEAERFGLTAQLRRGAVSVPSNIAEGYGRGGRAEYVRFLKIARGSLFEVETQLILASELGYVCGPSQTQIQVRLNRCASILAGLIRSLE